MIPNRYDCDANRIIVANLGSVGIIVKPVVKSSHDDAKMLHREDTMPCAAASLDSARAASESSALESGVETSSNRRNANFCLSTFDTALSRTD